MGTLRMRRPSPAMVVALLALVLAMGGTAVATEVGLNAKQKRQVKAIADQQIESKAALLTVGRSKTGSCDPSSAAFVKLRDGLAQPSTQGARSDHCYRRLRWRQQRCGLPR